MKPVLISIAVVCGLAAAYIFGRWSTPSPAPSERVIVQFVSQPVSDHAGDELVSVIVANKELPVGTVLDDLDNITIAKFPKESLPADMVNKIEGLKGKRLTRTLRKGNFFSEGDLSVDSGIKIPEGQYKYVIVMNTRLGPGDRADIYLNEMVPNGKNDSEAILRDILILGTDAFHRKRGGEWVNTTSIAVTSKQSLILAAAEKRGELKLRLHDPDSADMPKP